MGNSGIIGVVAAGNVAQPSPSVWAHCPNTLLNDKGLGYFIAQDFLGDYSTPAATTTAPGIEFASVGTNVFGTAASSTFGPNVLSAATGATDNNHLTLYGEALGSITRNIGREYWFETRIALTALGDAAFAVGLTTLANAIVSAGPIADNPSNSAVATMTSASFIAFVSAQAASAIATVNIVYEKTTGTPVTVLADATNASALIAYEATLGAGEGITQAAAVTAQATAPIGDGITVLHGNLLASGFRKFGIYFDGQKTIYFFVDGVQVAKQEVDSTFDQAAYYVPFVALKNGASTAITGNVDFIRAGFQLRS